MILRYFLSVIMLGFMSAVVCAAENSSASGVLTYEAFSQKVLAYYPKLKQAHANVDLALARKMEAESGFWPTLDLSAGYKISDDPVNVFGMLLKEERFTSSDFDLKRLNTPDRHQDFSGGVHLDIPLFDAMQTIGRSRAAREGVKASSADEAYTRMEALLLAEDAYLNAVTLQKVAALIDEVEKDSREDLKKAAELKDKGMILGADYYAARVMFGDVLRMKNEVSRQKKAMMTLLNILMGESVHQAWTLLDIKENDVTAFDLAGSIGHALSQRPDLAALEARTKAAQAVVARERAGVLPRLSAFADAVNDRNKINADGGNNYTVGLKGSIALFDPGREGRIREALASKALVEQDIVALKDAIRRDVSMELSRYEAFLDNKIVLSEMREDARQAVALMVPLYSEGRKSIADLLEMRRAYFHAAEAYSKLLTGAWMSHGRLLFLTGKFDEVQVKAIAQGAGL